MNLWWRAAGCFASSLIQVAGLEGEPWVEKRPKNQSSNPNEQLQADYWFKRKNRPTHVVPRSFLFDPKPYIAEDRRFTFQSESGRLTMTGGATTISGRLSGSWFHLRILKRCPTTMMVGKLCLCKGPWFETASDGVAAVEFSCFIEESLFRVSIVPCAPHWSRNGISKEFIQKQRRQILAKNLKLAHQESLAHDIVRNQRSTSAGTCPRSRWGLRCFSLQTRRPSLSLVKRRSSVSKEESGDFLRWGVQVPWIQLKEVLAQLARPALRWAIKIADFPVRKSLIPWNLGAIRRSHSELEDFLQK